MFLQIKRGESMAKEIKIFEKSFEEKRKIFIRLMKKIKIDETGCWIWTGYCKHGYGQISIDGVQMAVHRVMYELIWGKIPEDHLIRHFCHKGECCNPFHISTGTEYENAQDMKEAGRSLRGEKNPRSKLTKEQAESIIKDKRDVKIIAKEYDITNEHVNNIKTGKRWPHLTRKYSKKEEQLTLEFFTKKNSLDLVEF